MPLLSIPSGSRPRLGAAQTAAYKARLFQQVLTSERLPLATPEYRFDTVRRWRFDFAWPEFMVALEVEGGIWTAGRHTRGKGFTADMQKYNRAVVLGWKVLRVVPKDLHKRETIEMLRLAIGAV